jgi:glycosyltransferase involved in cell wall biosynthesis
MKILYHHRTLSKDGQNVHIEELIAAFKDEGHEVCVVGPPGHQEAAFGSDGGFLSRLRATLPRAASELAELFYSTVDFVRLYKAYRAFRPDVIYERYNLFLLSGAWLSRLTGLPFILEVNAPLVLERSRNPGLALPHFAQWCERYVWRQAHLILPVTGILAHHLRAAGVERPRIRTIMNGINPRHFPDGLNGAAIRAKYGLEGKVVVGFTGFLRDWHGLPDVIDVMARLIEHYPLHFLVVGDGPAHDQLVQHAKDRGLSEHLTVTGVVGRADIPAHVAAFDIAVQPKATEYASPLKLFEYMAVGCAILAPDQPNLREVLSHDVNAVLFTPGDLQSFQCELQRLIEDRALRARLSSAAAQTIRARDLTWNGNARRVASAFRKLAPSTTGL